MSFSYGSVPEPESPPLKALALSPAPARTDRRAKRHTTLSPPDISSLSLDSDPLSLDGVRNMSALQRSVSARPTPRANANANANANGAGATTIMSAMSIHQSLTTYNSSAGTLISPMPVPRMINPLPAHYRHPSPSPSYESSTPSLTSSSTAADSNCSSYSAASNASSVSSASSHNPNANGTGTGMKRRKSLVAKPSLNNICQRAQAPHTSDDSLSSSCEPHTPTSTTFSRSRGKSISRAVGKLASDFLSLKRKDKENKDRSESDSIPAVPALPSRK